MKTVVLTDLQVVDLRLLLDAELARLAIEEADPETDRPAWWFANKKENLALILQALDS